MADYQVLPPGLSQVTYKAETVDPNTFQINGRVLFFSAVRSILCMQDCTV